MIVVADSSPLNYLLLIGEEKLLADLYGAVTIPTAVHQELTAGGAPERVRQWAAALPSWVSVKSVVVPHTAEFEALDDGEAEAIVLADELKPDVVLIIDERKGRQEALRRGIRITGVLGVLNDAAGAGLVDLPAALQRLGQTSFRVSPALLRELLDRAQRKRP